MMLLITITVIIMRVLKQWDRLSNGAVMVLFLF